MSNTPGVDAASQPEVPQTQTGWSAGSLFNCCAIPSLCCQTFWCPCLTYREIRMNTYGGPEYNTDPCDPALMYCIISLTGFHLLLGMVGRNEVRRKYDLEGSAWSDCCSHFWCHCCAMCQEARELRAHPVTPYGVFNNPAEAKGSYLHGPFLA